MLASDHAETQQGGVLDGIEQYELPRSAVVRIAKTAVRLCRAPQALPDAFNAVIFIHDVEYMSPSLFTRSCCYPDMLQTIFSYHHRPSYRRIVYWP